MKKVEDYIYNIPKFSKKCSLDNTRELLKRLDNPALDKKIIHIAGTNGKGSVCSYLASILNASGYRVGTFTSPHLVRMNERIRIDGKEITNEAFVAGYSKVRVVSEEMVREGFCHPSFFEFLFGMAMDFFGKNDVDYIILETGLGGRLDATNAISSPTLCIITSIGLDHTDILGDTIEAIAKEKAGIIKPMVPVVFGDYNEISSRVIVEKADELNAPAYGCVKEHISEIVKDDKYIDFSINNEYYDNVRFSIKSKGLYQTENAMLALTAAGVLGIKNIDNIKKGLKNAVWEGRMQELEKNMILDGAHNEDGINRFIESVLQDDASKRYMIFSAVKDKHYEDMIKKLCDSKLFQGYILVPIQDERGLSVKTMEAEFLKHGEVELLPMENLSQGIFEACMLRDEGYTIYIAGSLYLAGEVLALRVE